MTAQAAASRVERYAGITAYWVAYIGTLCIWFVLAAFLLMPLGTLVVDYWTPKIQALVQPAKGGKR